MDTNAVLDYIKKLPIDERDSFFDYLKDNYCLHCGSNDTTCQCWNDE